MWLKLSLTEKQSCPQTVFSIKQTLPGHSGNAPDQTQCYDISPSPLLPPSNSRRSWPRVSNKPRRATSRSPAAEGSTPHAVPAAHTHRTPRGWSGPPLSGSDKGDRSLHPPVPIFTGHPGPVRPPGSTGWGLSHSILVRALHPTGAEPQTSHTT